MIRRGARGAARFAGPALVMRHIRWSIDRNAGTASATWFGLARREASHDPARGCVLGPVAAPSERLETTVVKPRFDLTLAPNEAVQSVVATALAESDAERLKRTRAVVVMHRGRIVAEAYAPGIAAKTPLPGWSMAKSAVNALVGVLVARGELSRSTPLVALAADDLASWRAAGDPRSTLTVEHALTMTTGLAFNETYVNPLDVMRMLLIEGASAARHPGTCAISGRVLRGRPRRTTRDDHPVARTRRRAARAHA